MNQCYPRNHIGVSMALLFIGLALLSIDRLGVTFETFVARSTAALEQKTGIQDDSIIHNSIHKLPKEALFPLHHSTSTNITVVGLVDYCVGDSYITLKKLIAYNRQTYANKWNYTIFSGNEDVFPAQTFIEPRAWLKAAYFYQLLTSTQTRDVDWFLWVDCDALITRFDLSVDDVLSDLKTSLNIML